MTPIEYVYVEDLENGEIWCDDLGKWLKKVPITELVGDAEEFSEWKEKNFGYLFFKDGKWQSTGTGADKTYTTAELYQLFKSKQ